MSLLERCTLTHSTNGFTKRDFVRIFVIAWDIHLTNLKLKTVCYGKCLDSSIFVSISTGLTLSDYTRVLFTITILGLPSVLY